MEEAPFRVGEYLEADDWDGRSTGFNSLTFWNDIWCFFVVIIIIIISIITIGGGDFMYLICLGYLLFGNVSLLFHNLFFAVALAWEMTVFHPVPFLL